MDPFVLIAAAALLFVLLVPHVSRASSSEDALESTEPPPGSSIPTLTMEELVEFMRNRLEEETKRGDRLQAVLIAQETANLEVLERIREERKQKHGSTSMPEIGSIEVELLKMHGDLRRALGGAPAAEE